MFWPGNSFTIGHTRPIILPDMAAAMIMLVTALRLRARQMTRVGTEAESARKQLPPLPVASLRFFLTPINEIVA
jgi:hypothetical protein